MSWHRGKVTLAMMDGEQEVQAVVWGEYAVHKRWHGNGWAVTYIPLGMRCCEAGTAREAKAKATLIHEYCRAHKFSLMDAMKVSEHRDALTQLGRLK